MKNTGNLPVHSSVQGGYWSHPEWSHPVASLYTSVMLLYTNVPESYRILPVGYRKIQDLKQLSYLFLHMIGIGTFLQENSLLSKS